MACRRSRGQPLDSKRQTVLCQREALSPLPCTNTMGGCSPDGSVVAQPASTRPVAASTRRMRRCSIMVCLPTGFNRDWRLRAVLLRQAQDERGATSGGSSQYKQGPWIWLCQSAGVAAAGGSAVREATSVGATLLGKHARGV